MNSTSDGRIYCIDSCALIDLHNHYWSNIFKTLWTSIDDLIAQGRLCTIEDVYNEVHRPMDAVKWLEERENKIIRTYCSETLDCLTRVMCELPDFVNPEQTSQYSADQFLVATALEHNSSLAHGLTGPMCILTQERPKKPGANLLKIPDACNHFSVACVNLQGLMEYEGWEF